ncbi:MAG: hypothetical protein ACHQ1H_11375, partial [Nitrososphaerales archaeon]
MSFAEEKGFNGKILECLDGALDTLGEGVKPSLYYRIEKTYNMRREAFVTKPLVIIDHLEQILGPTGSAVVERLMVREIRKAF